MGRNPQLLSIGSLLRAETSLNDGWLTSEGRVFQLPRCRKEAGPTWKLVINHLLR